MKTHQSTSLPSYISQNRAGYSLPLSLRSLPYSRSVGSASAQSRNKIAPGWFIMAKPGKTSPLSESRASSFTRKRTCSHLGSSSPRMKAQKRALATSGNEEPTSDSSNSEDSPGPENVVEYEDGDGDWARLGLSSSVDCETHRDNRDWNNKLALHHAEKGKEEVYLQECGIEAFHGTSVNGPPNSHRAVRGGVATANDSSSHSDSSADVAYELGDTHQPPTEVSKVNCATSSSALQKTKSELRRERKARWKEIKRLRAEKALQQGQVPKLNSGIQLPKGGNGFVGQENDNGEESCKELGGETLEGEEAGDDGDNLIIGSSGVLSSPVLTLSTPMQRLDSIPDNFIDVSTDSDSSITDKDLYTRRLKVGKEAKSLQLTTQRSIAPKHNIIEISSDDGTFNAASASASSLESGEEISITEPLTTFCPPISEKTLPRVRLLMQYYTPLPKSPSPEQSIYPVDTGDFRLPSPKRRKTEDDLSLREFFQRQVCGVCANEGHEERECEKLRCRYCLAWDKHFSHACPHKPPKSESPPFEEGGFDWRHAPPASITKVAKKVHPDQLNIACYACASENHFGGDCPSDWRTKAKGPWSMRYAESMGWNVDNISVQPAEKTSRGAGGWGGAVFLNHTNRNMSPKHDRDPPRDNYRNHDHDRNRRDRDWNRDKHRGGGVIMRSSAGRLRSRSPPRSGGYGRNRSRDRSRDRRVDRRRRSPPPPRSIPPAPPRSMLPPLPPPVGNTRAGGRGGAGNSSRAGRGRGLAERIRMPSSGRKEWRG